MISLEIRPGRRWRSPLYYLSRETGGARSDEGTDERQLAVLDGSHRYARLLAEDAARSFWEGLLLGVGRVVESAVPRHVQAEITQVGHEHGDSAARAVCRRCREGWPTASEEEAARGLSEQTGHIRRATSVGRPNILYIMSDDHATSAVSCYGSRLASVFQTPNIDRIANEGARLGNFFATNAICTPARANIMTGQYGHINGVRTLDDAWQLEGSPNLAAVLQEVGYDTALFGKWHLHCEPAGFGEYKYLSKHGGQGTYRDPDFAEKDCGAVNYKGYVTDIITGMALDWLRARGRTRPFFLMCHHKAPHDLWEYPERHEHLLDGIDIPVPDSLFEDKSHRSIASREFGASVTPRSKVRNLYEMFCRPDYVTGPLAGTENLRFEEKGVAAYQKYLRDYLRTVAGIDDSVGALLGELERQGCLDDTIVIYTSDQGMFLGEHDYWDKRWSYEESLRSPFLVRYPPEIPAQSVRDGLMANIDVAPTLLDYAGTEVPEDMQGLSCRELLGGDPEAARREVVYFRYWMHLAHGLHVPAHYGIRTDRWKLIFYYGLPLDATGAQDEKTPAGWELYDMARDPFELHNLYAEPACAGIARELRQKLDEAKQQYGDSDEQYPDLRERLRTTG